MSYFSRTPAVSPRSQRRALTLLPLLFAFACGAPDTSEAGTGAEGIEGAAIAENQQAATQGCIRGAAKDFVGSAFDALTGTSEAFPFVDGYTACEDPIVKVTNQKQSFVSDSYELERSVSSSVTIDGEGSYALFSANANVKRTVEEKVKFSRNHIVFVAEEEVFKTKVTLDAGVPFNATFEDYLSRPDGKSLIHGAFGDVFVKTAHLGHRINIIYSAEIAHSEKYTREHFAASLDASFKNASFGAALKTTYHNETQVREMLSQMRITVLALSQSDTVLAVKELTPAGVKATLEEFRATANGPGYGAPIRLELEPFGQHGKSEAQFFDWRSRLDVIAHYGSLYHQAKRIADLGTSFRDLTTRARQMMTGAQWYIDQYRTPAGYQGSGQALAAFQEMHYHLRNDAAEYETLAANSQHFYASRVAGVCLSVADAGAGHLGAAISPRNCSTADGQLFRYDSATQEIRSLSGHCFSVAGGGATGDIVLANCQDSPAQNWTFWKSEKKIDCCNARDINLVGNGQGTLLRGVLNRNAYASGWSRSSYREFSWHRAN
ncbi:MAG TPA: RICIN domain-containing protein [Polyangiaceae bacterium]|nr:RICIN domain-containing protein [Polyangiaceae bacterium]